VPATDAADHFDGDGVGGGSVGVDAEFVAGVSELAADQAGERSLSGDADGVAGAGPFGVAGQS
jgi:hypothetical protein